MLTGELDNRVDQGMYWQGYSGAQRHTEQSALIVTEGKEDKRKGLVSQTSLQEAATKDLKTSLQTHHPKGSWPPTVPPCTPGLWHMGLEGAVNMETIATLI